MNGYIAAVCQICDKAMLVREDRVLPEDDIDSLVFMHEECFLLERELAEQAASDEHS